MSVKSLVARAKEMGAQAIALTDHGVVTGFYEFMNACEGAGIKPIPGVETYFFPDRTDESDKTKSHLILMAKDIEGYKAIAKAVTESFKHLSGGANSVPRMDYKLLRKWFGKGAAGHGRVYATSACMNGVLADIILADQAVLHEAEKIERKRDKYHPNDDEFLDLKKEKEENEAVLAELIVERDHLASLSKTSAAGLTRRLKTMKVESQEAKDIESEIEGIHKQNEKANKELADIKLKIASQKRKNTLINQKYKAIEAQVIKWEEENDKAKAIRESVQTDDERLQKARETATEFVNIFGKNNYFIELQYHGIKDEARVMPILASLGNEMGIPLIAANDAHYAKKEDARARELVSALRFDQIINEDEKPEGYGELYIKTDAELREALEKILPSKTVDEAISNIDIVEANCNIVLVKGNHYPKYKSKDGTEVDPGELLRALAEKGIERRFPDKRSFTKAYRERLEYELDVISKSGFNDYLCIVQDFLNFGRKYATENEYGVGYTIGPGRGSAVGSLVCYLTGITSIDPLKYGLLFERFLNLERVSMPDIDSDFHTEIRGEVLKYVKGLYGENAVASITTKGTMAAKLAIRNAGRVTDVPLSVVDTITRQIPNKPGTTLDDLPNEVLVMGKANPIIDQLIKDARAIEGVISSFGTHAAGVIISDNDDVSDYVALMYNPDKDQWAVQCDMGECEHDAGLLKMDFLGLKNIDVINETLQYIYVNKGEKIDIEQAPFEEEIFSKIFSAGKTNSVFQFESNGMKEMLRQFKPSDINDLILLVAAYRPGPMQYLDSIIKVKHGKETPEYIVPKLKPILAPTYGKPIYQEQVMQIFNKVAGFSLGEADIIRRAMGKKKIDILTDPSTNYKNKFIDGLIRAGASETQAENFWNELLDFANYAFNKSHAAAYAFVAYYTAWLKYHYTAEFMCAVMARADRTKLPALIAECRSMGLTVSGPDINHSVERFKNKGDNVLFGFSDIKGVANAGSGIIAERDKNGQYRSYKDLINRTIAGKGEHSILNKTVAEALIQSGALDSFGNRASLLEVLEPLMDTVKKLKNKEIELAERKDELLKEAAKGATEKAIAALNRKISNSEKSVEELKLKLRDITLLPKIENKAEKLEKEKEILGFYISGSPLDDYDDIIKKSRVASIANVTSGNCRVCGMISELTIKQRKSDGKPLAFFKLTDKTGETSVKCWTKEYALFKDLIDDGAVVVIEGRMDVEDPDDESSEAGLTVKTLKEITIPNKTQIIISVPSVIVWIDKIRELVSEYASENGGCKLVVHDMLLDELRDADFTVAEKILSANFGDDISIRKLA
jgi:DNA polymerase-3 subunit alpha